MIERKQLNKNRQSIVDAFSGKLNHLHPQGAPAPKSAKAKAKAKAKALAAEAAANAIVAKGNGKDKAKSKSKKPKTGDGDAPVCWFYNCGVHTPNIGTCNKTAEECNYKHSKVSLAEFNKMEKPTRNRSASRGAASDGGQGKGKGGGEGKAKSKAKPTVFHWCRDFLKEGGCKRGVECQYPQLTSDAVEARKLAATNLKNGGAGS